MMETFKSCVFLIQCKKIDLYPNDKKLLLSCFSVFPAMCNAEDRQTW